MSIILLEIPAIENIQQLHVWMKKARPLEQVVYHVGILMRDRQPLNEHTTEKLGIVDPKQLEFINRRTTQLDKLALRVAELEERGKLITIQKRVTNMHALYIVFKPPPPPPTHHPRVPVKYGNAKLANR